MITATDPDVIIVGGGHYGLVAAALLARAGQRVVLLEANTTFGGAVASEKVFTGVDASLSRFSYLVSVLPQSLVEELGLDLKLRSRTVASYTPVGGRGASCTPVGDGGLLVERPESDKTRASFAALTGGPDTYAAWESFHARVATFAAVVAPTLMCPLPRAAALRAQLDPALWDSLTVRPIGELIEETFTDDTVRGVVLTDALIGILTGAHDPSLRQNRCFAYHVIGNGTGEWKVPVGGMGAVARALEQAALDAGADLRRSTPVTAIRRDDAGVLVETGTGTLHTPYVLAGCAPAVLDRLRGLEATSPEGSQTKINLVVRRLPRLRSGLDPRIAFAGTLHLGQGYARLAEARAEAEAGQIPDPMPCEVYCHTLTDDSILSPELRASGAHTLTIFGLHTPARLFRDDPDTARRQARDAALHSLQDALAEPLEDCLLMDADGQPCVEVMTPLDVEAAIQMPGGHIFHGDLAWPWLDDDGVADTPATRWGVATDDPRILLCGSGSVRGGAVSGLGGHSAAMALLEILHGAP